MELTRAMADKKPERMVCLNAGFAGNTMFLIDVVHVISLDGYRLELIFKDGLKAVVDLRKV